MTNCDINIVGAKLLKGSDLIKADISIANGKIIKIGKHSNVPKAEKEIDANGLLALPGLIDAHVHLRDMQLSHKEDYYSGTCAAAAGGFTTVLDMPNTIPPTDSCERLKEKIDVAKQKAMVNIGFHAMLNKEIHELAGLTQMGIMSFKLYLNKSEQDLDVSNDELLCKLMNECAQLNTPLTIHAEELSEVKEIDSLNNHIKNRSEELEVNALRRILGLVQKSRCQAHICHLSASESVLIIKKERKSGLNISCEVTPHHLFLSKDLFKEHGALILTDPPLRNKKTIKNLFNALPGLETTLPLLLTEVNSKRLTLKRIVDILAEGPARIFHLDNKGALEEGKDADLTLVDLKAEHVIRSDKLFTKAEYSPFDGVKCKGRAVKVFVSGNQVMESGEIIENPGIGKIITRDI
jgi:dihydroorotase